MNYISQKVAVVLVAAAIFFTSKVNAQTTSYGKFGLDIGIEAGAPTYKAHSTLSNVELGGTARLQMGISSNLALIVTSGYYNMFDKNITVNNETVKAPGLGIVPVKGGLKGILGGDVYYTGEAGAGFETSRDLNTDQKDVKLIFAGGLGYAANSWDVGIRYESFIGQNFNYGLIGLRLAYVMCGSSKK